MSRKKAPKDPKTGQFLPDPNKKKPAEKPISTAAPAKVTLAPASPTPASPKKAGWEFSFTMEAADAFEGSLAIDIGALDED